MTMISPSDTKFNKPYYSSFSEELIRNILVALSVSFVAHSLSRWLIEENLAQKERVIARVKAFIA